MTDKQTATWEKEFDGLLERLYIIPFDDHCAAKESHLEFVAKENLKGFIKQNFTHNSECISEDEVRKEIEKWGEELSVAKSPEWIIVCKGRITAYEDLLAIQEHKKATTNQDTK